MNYRYGYFIHVVFTLIWLNGFLVGQLNDIASHVDLHRISRQIIQEKNAITINSVNFPTNNQNIGASVSFISIDSIDSVQFRFNGAGFSSKWISGKLHKVFQSTQYIAGIHWDSTFVATSFSAAIFSNSLSIEYVQIGLFIEYIENDSSYGIAKSTKTALIPKPRIISRAEWGAEPPTYGFSEMNRFDQLTIHHAAGWRADDLETGILAVYDIQQFHQNIRGWSDIGYHFLIDRAGNIFQGRPETVLGSHVGGANYGNIGVCILGCYHPPNYMCNDMYTRESRDSAKILYAWLSQTYDIDPYVLKGHRDYFGTTSCPGNTIWIEILEMRMDIDFYVNLDGLPLKYSTSSSYPNPFNSTASFILNIPYESSFHIAVYNIVGRHIIDLRDEFISKGNHIIKWNGLDNHGNQSPSGVYLVRINGEQNEYFDKYSHSLKMLLIK
ncbi:MAG: N-acetylmuramoyl-L-alanine amidase [Candidatus Marinimicrobia bacterium]|nr:N-acetylmuramoyl-L-alanine amidase [Candidatus Neomarinimicrobiota bacterium]